MAKSLNLLENYSMMTLGQEKTTIGAPICNNGFINSTTVKCPAIKPLQRMTPPLNGTKFP
jgi:hypothetical protein